MFMDMTMEELLNKKEPLDNELEECLNRGAAVSIRHPLLYSTCYSECSNALLNAQLRFRKEAVEKAQQEKDFGAYIWLHERPYRMHAFNMCKEWMTDDEYWPALCEIWTDSENIWQNKDEWAKLLSSKRTNKHLFMDEDERDYFNALPDKVVIYRGCEEHNMDGMSWTLDREVAQMFANKYRSKTGIVRRRMVSKNKLFAYVDLRQEQELILLP